MFENSNVRPMRGGHWPIAQREVEEISFDKFCIALEAGEWQSRHFISGMTILQYPRVLMICCDDGKCTVVKQVGTNMDAYFYEALEALDEVA